MPIDRKLTEDDARQALRQHVAARAELARERYGPQIGRAELERMLRDPDVSRWPTSVRFDAEPLRAGEFGFAAPDLASSEGEWTITLDPRFENDDDAVVLLAAYHMVTVNYGEIASHTEAELFGATLLGISEGDYYQRVCARADE